MRKMALVAVLVASCGGSQPPAESGVLGEWWLSYPVDYCDNGRGGEMIWIEAAGDTFAVTAGALEVESAEPTGENEITIRGRSTLTYAGELEMVLVDSGDPSGAYTWVGDNGCEASDSYNVTSRFFTPSEAYCPDVCDEPWDCQDGGCRCGTTYCNAPCDPVCDAWPGYTCDGPECSCDTNEPLGPHIECTAP